MNYNLIIVMKNQEDIKINLKINATKPETSVLLNSQIIQNPNGKFNLKTENGEIALDIKDISHVIVL